jgi:hypothetical protein
MPSRILPIDEYEERHDPMVYLPPGGRHNDVSADVWVPIAELELRDVTVILGLLADADVGGYAALPGGQRAHSIGHYHLYVDRMKYNRAEEVLMVFLHGKESQPAGGDHRRALRGAATPARRRSAGEGVIKRIGAVFRNYSVAVAVATLVVVKFFGHGTPTPLMFLLAGAIGVVGMAAIDVGIRVRYLMANRALASKSGRRR